MEKKTSDLSGFYKLSLNERLRLVKEFASLTEEEANALKGNALPLETAEKMIENVIGRFELPIGIASYFLINGRDYLIPMVTEEPSVVAAASNSAKAAREGGGFSAEASEPLMIGQIQISKVKNIEKAANEIRARKKEILSIANEQDKTLVSFGGGAKDLEVRVINTKLGKMLITHLLVDCRDAMGANAVNTMCEAVAPYLQEISGGKIYLRIISNLAVFRLAKARARFPKEVIGEGAVEGVMQAYAFAEGDVFRCVTHNKGIMNGITAIALATGNDTRAIEAGAHAYAFYKNNAYKPLTSYEVDKNGDLTGSIELPIAAGTIGGATKTHPAARTCLKILGVGSAKELAMVMASVGLAQNFAALRALSTVGIQRGHMELHARNIAIAAGAKGELADKVAQIMAKEKKINFQRAKEILEEIEKK